MEEDGRGNLEGVADGSSPMNWQIPIRMGERGQEEVKRVFTLQGLNPSWIFHI